MSIHLSTCLSAYLCISDYLSISVYLSNCLFVKDIIVFFFLCCLYIYWSVYTFLAVSGGGALFSPRLKFFCPSLRWDRNMLSIPNIPGPAEVSQLYNLLVLRGFSLALLIPNLASLHLNFKANQPFKSIECLYFDFWLQACEEPYNKCLYPASDLPQTFSIV